MIGYVNRSGNVEHDFGGVSHFGFGGARFDTAQGKMVRARRIVSLDSRLKVGPSSFSAPIHPCLRLLFWAAMLVGRCGTISFRTDIKISHSTLFFFPFHFPDLPLDSLLTHLLSYTGTSHPRTHQAYTHSSHYFTTTQHNGLPIQSTRNHAAPRRPLAPPPQRNILPTRHHLASPHHAATTHPLHPAPSAVGVVRTFLGPLGHEPPHKLHTPCRTPHRAIAWRGARYRAWKW